MDKSQEPDFDALLQELESKTANLQRKRQAFPMDGYLEQHTLIKMADGSQKEISKILIGDWIYTDKGPTVVHIFSPVWKMPFFD